MKKDVVQVRSGSTVFARGVVYLVGAAALSVCFILLPELVREESVGKTPNLFLTISFLGSGYILSLPFFVALHQTLKLLNYIDMNKTFSHQSIKALQNIKLCAVIFGVLIVLAVVAWLSIARSIDPSEDVTFIVTFGGIFTFVASILAVFVALLQKLLTEAVALKSENDLIV